MVKHGLVSDDDGEFPDNLAKMILQSPSEHEDYIIGASYRAASCKEEFVNGEWVKVA